MIIKKQTGHNHIFNGHDLCAGSHLEKELHRLFVLQCNYQFFHYNALIKQSAHYPDDGGAVNLSFQAQLAALFLNSLQFWCRLFMII